MQNGILLEQENKKLRAAKAAQKQKRARINRRIAYEAGISVREAQEDLQAHEASLQPTAPSPAAPVQPIQQKATPARRHQYICSICGATGHKPPACPVR